MAVKINQNNKQILTQPIVELVVLLRAVEAQLVGVQDPHSVELVALGWRAAAAVGLSAVQTAGG